MKTLRQLFFISLFLIISSQQIYSQESDSIKSETKISAFKLTEIPIEIEKATSLIVLEESKLKDSKNVIEAKKLFAELNLKYDVLSKKFEALDVTKQSSGKIKELLRHWQVIQKDVFQLLNDISERTTFLENQNTEFDHISNVWDVTKSKASKKDIPVDLLNSINDFQKNLNHVKELIKNELNTLLIIQSDLSKQNIEIEKVIVKIVEIDNAQRRDILTRNAVPIWKMSGDTTETKSISEEFSDIIISYKTAYSEFLVTYEDDLPIFIFMFLLFFLFVLSLKINSKKIESNDQKIEQSLIILNYPFSATMLIFGILMTFFYGDAPAAFKSIVKIVLLIPLVRISIKIINPSLIKALYVFTGLFVLNQIKVAASSATSIERLLLFALEFISILGIVWIIKKNYISDNLYSEEKKSYMHIGRKIVFVLFSISLLANILGYIKLGIVLLNGVYDTIFATFILMMGTIIMHSMLLVFLKTKAALKFRVVKFQADKIKHTTEKIIQRVVKIIWIVVVLNAFNIYVPVRDWIVATILDEIGFGAFSISLADILLFIVTIWASHLISKFLRFILDADILPRLSLPRGVPGAISTLTKYFILTLGFIIAVTSVGLDLSKFTLLAGALGVGIGFGLQDLVNNFISGLILIFERPIQVGDVVHFNQIEGRVTNIGIRASRIKTWQGSEIIVPNGHLVSNDVINWTFSDKMSK